MLPVRCCSCWTPHNLPRLYKMSHSCRQNKNLPPAPGPLPRFPLAVNVKIIRSYLQNSPFFTLPLPSDPSGTLNLFSGKLLRQNIPEKRFRKWPSLCPTCPHTPLQPGNLSRQRLNTGKRQYSLTPEAWPAIRRRLLISEKKTP